MSARTFAEALRVETAMLQAQHPTRDTEIARAHALIANGQVVPMDDGNALVLSSTDASVWYDVNGTCSCPDAQYREGHCKHLSAWKLYQHIQHQVDTETPPAPIDVPPPALPPGPGLPLPEAPVSITLKGFLHGQDVMVTVRGVDFTRVQAQAEAASRWLDAPPPQAAQCPPSPPTSDGWCEKHQQPLKLNHGKDGRTWYSHKTPDGWCKGR